MRERTTGVVQTRGRSESNCAEPKARARELELETIIDYVLDIVNIRTLVSNTKK